MDKCSTDAEFDSYWDYEAKNKNRNRIRVGRQYQATVPPLLKPGEKDGRKSEDLETLKWKPGQISDQDVEHYLSMAKGIGLLVKAVDNSKAPEKSDNPLQSAFKGLSEFVTSHHPCHHDDGCQVPKPSSSGESSSTKPNINSDWSPSESKLFAQALKACGKNFCAIKKEFLPWKPVRSIIEYYYQGKGDKSPSQNLDECLQQPLLSIKKDQEYSLQEIKKDDDSLQIKQDEEPVAGCSYEEKPSIAKIEVSSENPSPQNLDFDPKSDAVNFLENSRATDACQDGTDMKMSVPDQDTSCAPSTIGSLKFFLGGRLVLKLNARQDSGSGTKCQWVQSNDLPKLSNSSKKVKHKKKVIQDFVSSPPETPQKKKRTDEQTVTHRMSDYSLSANKKPRLKSEYEFSETDKHGMLLCSSYWTPPVADGQESVDMDDASSKTSEGYVSPVLSNSRPIKSDARGDFACNINSVHEFGEKCDSDQCSAKYNNAQSDHFTDDSASKNLCFVGGKNSPSQFADDAFLKQEVLNHKSALSHSKFQAKSPCYQPRSSHSNSPLMKQWSKWSNMPYSVRTSPSSLSPVSVVDSKSPVKEIPLDLSSKFENDASSLCDKTCTNTNCHEKAIPSEAESGPASSEFSPPSSSLGSQPQSVDSPRADAKNNSSKCSGSSTMADPQLFVDALKKENSCCSTKASGDSSQISYTCCNLPNCASPKCTKDYCSEDHPCNKSNPESNHESCSGYTVQDVDVQDMCKKNPGWCRASFVQFYPHCYPYYLTYSITPSPGSESSGAEMPLDLSSAGGENLKDKVSSVPEKLSEDVNDVPQNNTAEAVERGMLYQLLKNKTSK